MMINKKLRGNVDGVILTGAKLNKNLLLIAMIKNRYVLPYNKKYL